MAKTPLPLRLLGAPGTGKTQLAAALRTALSSGQHAALSFTLEDDPAMPGQSHGALAGVSLLMGLDLPVPAAFAELQQAADRALRATLAQSGISYQVVYGQGDQRLHSALSALQAWLPGTGGTAEGATTRKPWVWTCDNCSDPQCERRLLSDLLATRIARP